MEESLRGMDRKKKNLLAMGVVFLVISMLSGCGGGETKVAVSVPSGEYYGPQVVELAIEPSGEDYDLYFTLDGNDPTRNSNRYNPEKPLVVSFDSVLKVVGIKGSKVTPIAEASYTIKEKEVVVLNDAERLFLSNIRGEYQLDNNTISIALEGKIISWNIDGVAGTSECTVDCPEAGDGTFGTIICTDGSGMTFTVDQNPSGDNAVYFNDVNYNYIG